LLDGARGALQREDPAAALEAAEQHARAYPTGILAQEREAMAIRALVMLGRTPEAQARTDLFRSRFPDSLLQPTLDSTVEAGGP
jgi:outer membrane protein assembly factor BamD (BamD/ComL family)